MERFFAKIRTYTQLSGEAENAWKSIIKENRYAKGETFLSSGADARKIAFVLEGLLYQYHYEKSGGIVITHFFEEGRIAASYCAMFAQEPTLSVIEALEATHVIEFDFFQFKRLTIAYPEIGDFYVRYIEQHYIPEKEAVEALFRYQSARERYLAFTRMFPDLINRLKKKHVAAFLGITPARLAVLTQVREVV